MSLPAASIKGIVPVSMLDWQGKIVSTLFLGGCNLRCCFCHNADLVTGVEKLSDVSWEKVEKHLIDKKEWLDGCVVSGGEPCVDSGLKSLLSQIKKLGYPIKLDTNGTLPRVLSQLIKDELVDYIAMDFKTRFEKYPDLAQTLLDADCIRKSAELVTDAVREGAIAAEFRTTVVPGYVDEEDVLEIAAYLGRIGAPVYFLQQFEPKHVMEPELSTKKPYSDDFLLNLADKCCKYVPTKYRSLIV